MELSRNQATDPKHTDVVEEKLADLASNLSDVLPVLEIIRNSIRDRSKNGFYSAYNLDELLTDLPSLIKQLKAMEELLK